MKACAAACVAIASGDCENWPVSAGIRHYLVFSVSSLANGFLCPWWASRTGESSG